jgi:DNA repair exonuclease SbcCD ATPase subunit
MRFKKASVSLLLMTVFLLETVPVLAVSPSPSGSAGAKQERRLDLVKTNAEREIDRRLTSLTALVDRINAMKRVSSDQKAQLSSQIQSVINDLKNLKNKIAVDTDPAILKADKQSIVDSYRIYLLFMPKMRIIAHADQALTLADEANTLMSKLQIRIDEAKSKGADVKSLQGKLDEMKVKIVDAKTQDQKAIDAVMPLMSDGYPGNKSTLNTGRDLLKTARQDLKTAAADARMIRKGLK